MSLYFRLFLAILRGLFLPKLSPAETLVVKRRVLPNDLDLNMHMNNGRYLTIVDLSLFEFFARTGFLKVIMKQKWRPMAGGCIITYRKGLKLFQPYEIRFRWTCAADGWNYMHYEFVAEDRLRAAGILKGGFFGPSGLTNTTEGIHLMPEKYQATAHEMMQRPVTQDVATWLESDALIYKQANDSVST